MEGVVHNCLESNLSSLRWRDGNESSVLLEHANAVKQWNLNQYTAFTYSTEKEGRIFRVYSSNSSEKYLCEPLCELRVSIPLDLTFCCHTLGDSVALKFSSVTQSCLTLFDPMDCSTPGLPVHHQLPKSAQIHVHRVGDAIQPSHSLSSPSPPTFNLSQDQGLFQ